MMHYHQYPPPPPPVATGPGLDRPLYAATTPSPDYGIADTAFGSSNGSNGHHSNATNGSYAMSRTRKYYHQDHHLDKDEADRKASFV